MRKRFEQQTVIGRLLIEDVKITTARRSGSLPSLCAALQKIYVTSEYNERIFKILEEKVFPANNHTGRQGMDLWHIFVLSQVRLCENISYDSLHYRANHDILIRQIMGIMSSNGFDGVQFGYQNIVDNVGLLDDITLREINRIVVEIGQGLFKKKEGTDALRLKTDSFVLESNVHFPTDYNLLWDSIRKSLDMIVKIQKQQQLPGWRKIGNWYKTLKSQMRSLGRASVTGGKGKAERVKMLATDYLAKSKLLYDKLLDSKKAIGSNTIASMSLAVSLDYYMGMMAKHIDLLERRLIKGEQIPHGEKLFSIFEEYTEWINKGKIRPNVELGKRVAITTDHNNLIVDYKTMEQQTDSEVFQEIVSVLSSKYKISSWSFDKGYWSDDNKKYLALKVETPILPKKGKLNNSQQEEQSKPLFKKIRKRHSAIESNINELEHRGLNRCPDRSYSHFKRYIGMAVCAYNLRKIGEELIKRERVQLQKDKPKLAA